MGASVDIELNHYGIRELLFDAGVARAVKEAADGIASRAGEGFYTTDKQSLGFNGGRVGYGVYSGTYQAMKAEAESKVLSKAVR